MTNKVEMLYTMWLFGIVTTWLPDDGNSYDKLIRSLHEKPFVSLMQMDDNRVEDARDLRMRFIEDSSDLTYRDAYIYLTKEPSVLEVLMALTIRMEDHLMYDEDGEHQYSAWFWSMISSLGLSKYSDKKFSEKRFEKIMEKFLAREYSENGSGGLFTLVHPPEDMRKIDIWKQMSYYIEEILCI